MPTTGWIFQGNPRKFNVDQYLAERNEVFWLVRPAQYANKLSVGHVAFIWRSDGPQKSSGGVVAFGRISHRAELREDDCPQRWREPVVQGAALRVGIKIEDKRLVEQDGMLLRTSLEQDDVLRNLWILKWRSQTTYPVESEHLRALIAFWSGARTTGRGMS
jgi:hypothetical protein